MRTRGLWLSVLCVAAGAVTGCVTLKRTPEARFFVLRSVVEPATPAVVAGEGIVGVLPVQLPGHLRRPQVVTEAGANELLVDEFVRWAEPLTPATTRVLSENLAALLPDRLVAQGPWAARAPLLCRVRVEVEAFAPRSDGEVRLTGRWALLGPDGPAVLAREDFAFRRGPVPVGPGGVDPESGTEAMSELLAELAGHIADAVERLPEPAAS